MVPIAKPTGRGPVWFPPPLDFREKQVSFSFPGTARPPARWGIDINMKGRPMAQAKSAETSPQDEMDHLSQQIATLREDISAISKTLAGLGGATRDAAVDGARRKVSDLAHASEQQLHAAQHRAEELGQQAADAVRNQPAAAVGLAVGLGFLLGFMTGRK
jgi:ElaB/YqjD/DUF883 family membrane-anchored ribosome-binding protein